jgi:hypothetical protein
LVFDPGKWGWRGGGPLHSYTAKQGRSLLNPRLQLAKPIQLKWQGFVEANFTPDWLDVWWPDRPQKDVGFLWSILHNAVAVNAWRHHIFPATPAQCTLCNSGLPKTRTHTFYDCVEVYDTWNFAFLVLYHAGSGVNQPKPWNRLSWRQCLLGTPLSQELLDL